MNTALANKLATQNFSAVINGINRQTAFAHRVTNLGAAVSPKIKQAVNSSNIMKKEMLAMNLNSNNTVSAMAASSVKTNRNASAAVAAGNSIN